MPFVYSHKVKDGVGLHPVPAAAAEQMADADFASPENGASAGALPPCPVGSCPLSAPSPPRLLQPGQRAWHCLPFKSPLPLSTAFNADVLCVIENFKHMKHPNPHI